LVNPVPEPFQRRRQRLHKLVPGRGALQREADDDAEQQQQQQKQQQQQQQVQEQQQQQ
jgi:hypothetical protein